MVAVILVLISNLTTISVMWLTHIPLVNNLRDGLRDKTSQNLEKLRDITSQINPASLIKKIECIAPVSREKMNDD